MNDGAMKYFFEPRSVAIIGASTSPDRTGHIVFRNLLRDFKGRVFPINPRADSILGVKAYPSVTQVPEDIDFAAIFTPAQGMLDIVRDCVQKHVKAAFINASGFADAGPEGKRLQDEMVGIARDGGLRLWGPNCLGIANLRNRLCTITFDLPAAGGNVSLVVQSGTAAGGLVREVIDRGLFFFSHICSIGNKCDVDESDILEYLVNDAGTKVIALYLESIRHGPRFMRLVKEASKRQFVLAVKSGRTPEGAAAGASHTGALAGNALVEDAAFRQCGVIRLDEIVDLIEVSRALSKWPIDRCGNRIAIVTSSGGNAVTLTDFLANRGLKIAGLSPATMKKVHEVLPSWVEPDKWLDIDRSELLGLHDSKKVIQRLVEATLEDEGVDGVALLLGAVPAYSTFDPGLAAATARKYGKPLGVFLYGVKAYREPWLHTLEDGGVPVFRDLRTMAIALHSAWICNLRQRSQR